MSATAVLFIADSVVEIATRIMSLAANPVPNVMWFYMLMVVFDVWPETVAV